MILRSDQVSSDCIVVDERAHNDVDVPDGVGQGDDPIALEEYHAKQIDGAACLKLCQSRNITHLVHSETWQQCDHHIESCFKGLVPLVKNLLIEYPQGGQKPHCPSQLHSGTIKLPEVEPRGVGAGYEEIDHGTISTM